jgi:hypothetical protein
MGHLTSTFFASVRYQLRLKWHGKMGVSATHFWVVTSLLVILAVALFDLRVMMASDTLQVQYIPDDAYYYLVLAKNFSRLGLWTFDSGLSVTSGFHPLLAYLLSFLYSIFHPTLSEYTRLGIAFSSFTTLAAALILWMFGLREEKPYYMILLAMIVSSTSFIYNSVSIMEWSLVILFAALYCICYYRSFRSPRKKDAFILFLLGLLGSLSRSDFGLLPFSFFIASLGLCYFHRNTRSVAVSLMGLSGAIVGVLLIFAHNQAFTGYFLQSSARMKAYWDQIFGADYKRAIELVPLMLGIGPGDSVAQILLAILGVLLLLVLVRHVLKKLTVYRMSALDLSLNRQTLRTLTMFVAGLLCLTGYIAFYGHSGGIRPWYTANLLIPTLMLLVILFKQVDARIDGYSRRFMKLGLSAVTIIVVLQSVLSSHFLDSSSSPWPYQQIMLDAGKYLSDQDVDGHIGAWNAGIIGYYQGGTVVNLDGLVNDDIYSYAISNQLPSYLSQKGIRYIIDFEQMLTAEQRRVKGGYDDVAFVDRLQPIMVFDDGRYGWKYMTLYRLLP